MCTWSHKISTYLLALIILAPFFVFNSFYSTANAFDFNTDSGLQATGNTGGFVTGTDTATVDSMIGLVITIVLGMVGVVFLVFMIYGGFVWMTADGSDEKIKKAKNTLINSIYGIIIVLSAYVISNFLINYFA